MTEPQPTPKPRLLRVILLTLTLAVLIAAGAGIYCSTLQTEEDELVLIEKLLMALIESGWIATPGGD